MFHIITELKKRKEGGTTETEDQFFGRILFSDKVLDKSTCAIDKTHDGCIFNTLKVDVD